MKILKHNYSTYINKHCRCDECCSDRRRYQAEQRRKKGIPKRLPAQHGTRSKYRTGCRCEPCKEASREYARLYRRKKGIPERKPAVHGSISMYCNQRCRCDDCKQAMSDYYKGRKIHVKYKEAKRGRWQVLTAPLNKEEDK